jgi:hypothetical protein
MMLVGFANTNVFITYSYTTDHDAIWHEKLTPKVAYIKKSPKILKKFGKNPKEW